MTLILFHSLTLEVTSQADTVEVSGPISVKMHILMNKLMRILRWTTNKNARTNLKRGYFAFPLS